MPKPTLNPTDAQLALYHVECFMSYVDHMTPAQRSEVESTLNFHAAELDPAKAEHQLKRAMADYVGYPRYKNPRRQG